MRRLLFAAFLASSTAHAQIPVTDIASITGAALQHVETLLKWHQQYEQMVSQYEKLTHTHDALTGVRNLGDIFDNPQLRQYMPADWQQAYIALRASGYEGLLRAGVDIYNANKVFDACAHIQSEDRRNNCEAMAVQSAQVQGDLLDTLDLIEQRREQVTDLQVSINNTSDPKAIAELQARIGIEQAAIANEATRLKVMADITAAEQRALQQREDEFQARTFAKTKGIVIEPLTFD